MDTVPELILAHLDSLLTEINAACFATDKKPADDKLTTYIRSKLLVENNFNQHTMVNEMARKTSCEHQQLIQHC